MNLHGLAVFLCLALLVACSGGTAPILDCEPADGITPDCRFHNPEDLVASPGGGFILVSQFGGMTGEQAGSLVAYEPTGGALERLFPLERQGFPPAIWGDPGCPPPPVDVFSPHGMDVESLRDGVQALYVVNHGGRESVEMFEVMEQGGNIGLSWRGCVLAPVDGNFNDLVVLRNGDFWVSQMFPRQANLTWSALRMKLTGYAPGFVYHWSGDGGFARLPGTDAKFANGVEKSADESHIFVNSYFGNEVIKVEVRSGERLGAAAVSSPDNLTWSPTGELLAASHHASTSEARSCLELAQGNCGFRFQIVAIDPDSLATRVLLDHAGPPMGAATVALSFGGQVYLGTFAGDRVARLSAAILDRN